MSLLHRHGLIRSPDAGEGPDLTDGLIGHWTLDSADLVWGDVGSEVKDTSGSGNDGLVSALFVTNEIDGVVGGALDPATNSSIRLDTSDYMFESSDQDFSAFGWARGLSDTENTFYLFDSRLSDDSGWDMRSVNGKMWAQISEVDVKQTSGVSSASGWVHYGVVVNRTGTAQIYVNGVTDGVPENVSGLTFPTAPATRFLRNNLSGAGSNCSGVDDLRIYNKAVSQEVVTALYNLGTP